MSKGRTWTGCGSLRNERGVGFVAVLLALLVLAVMYFGYFKMADRGGAKRAGVAAIDGSRQVACRTQRQNLERDIVLWKVNHPDDEPSIVALRAEGVRIPSCPEGGSYDIVRGGVTCSKHN